MITVFPADHALHDAPHEFLDGQLRPPFESPERAAIVRDAVERAAFGPIMPPRAFGIEQLQTIHDNDYLAYLEHAYERWVAAGGDPAAVLPSTLAVRWMGRHCDHPLAAPGFYSFDTTAPITATTYRAVRASADAALTGAALLTEGEQYAYALCRPPGHHAGTDMSGGYCYVNNAAVAAQFLLTQKPGTARVAILDVDYHHGNGTQQIFYERSDVLFVSIHADPAREYPYFAGFPDERGVGEGIGFNLNIALPAAVTDARYLAALEAALEAIAEFAPDALVVSLGLDTFVDDPLGDFALTSAAYPVIGRRIAALGLPTLVVQEGGYAVSALGDNVVSVLRGLLD